MENDNKKKKNNIWIIAIAAIAVVIVAVIITVIVLLNKKDTYRVIKIYDVQGTVYVQRDGISDLEPYANMLLKSGDTIRVENGSMTLKLDEDKYVYVEEHTEFSVVATGTSADSKTAIELKSGAITNEIQNKLSSESSYEVNTPNSTMAVRGTIFRVEVTYDEDGVCYTKVSVLEGEVSTRLVYADETVSDDEVMIDKGYEVIIYQDGENTDYLTEVSPIDYSKLPEFIREKFKDIIGEYKTTETIDDENEDNENAEYTVTFMYNGAVFGTQIIKSGNCASAPSLKPALSGKWDYDFSNPIVKDTVINWK